MFVEGVFNGFYLFLYLLTDAYVNQIRDGEEHFSHEKNGG